MSSYWWLDRHLPASETACGTASTCAHGTRTAGSACAAVEHGAEDEARTLLDQVPREHIDSIGPEGDTLLHLACLYGHQGCADMLLDHGASVAVRDDEDSTVLHDACATGCARTRAMLQDYGSDPISPAQSL